MLFASNQVYGGTEYRLGGKGGNDWQAALTEASIYQVLDADGQEIRQKPVGLSPFGVGADTLIHFSATSILPLRIDPEVNIAQADVDAVGYTWRSSVVFDFGAGVPINCIRFYPRLSRNEDHTLIEAMKDPPPDIETFGEDSFLDNFFAWYEILTGDNSIAFANDSCNANDYGSGLETISKPPAGFARLQSAWTCVALNRPITEDRAHSGALPTPISLALGPHSVF